MRRIHWVLLALFGLMSVSAQADWDSFRRTCNVIYEDYRIVQADCRDVQGNYRYNSFDKSRCEPGTISNQNGRLACIEKQNGGGGNGGWGLPSGSYRRSCTSCDVRSQTLQCQCKTVSGRYVRASLYMPSCGNYAAGNQNGRLVCE